MLNRGNNRALGDLPAGYTRVEFLESTGKQYVDSLLYVKPDSGFYGEATAAVIDPAFETLTGFHSYFSPFAVVPRNRRICFAYGKQDTTYYPQKDGSFIPSAGTGELPDDTFYLYEGRFKVGMNFKESAMWEYETANTTAKTALPAAPSAQTLSTMTLFGRRFLSGGGLVTDKYMWRGRIYSAIFSEGLSIVRKFVPALDPTGSPCMFDLVSRKPFYNAGTGDFLYPGKEEQATTYSLRRPRMYAQMTEHGIRRLYHVPKGCNLTKEEYAELNGFKLLVETPQPEEGYWAPVWHEREDCIELEWVETEPPVNEEENI